MKALNRVLQYIKGFVGQGLFLSSSSSPEIKAFSDTDWASCPETRRSITGFCVFISDSLVFWRSKKQHTVSRSIAELEYRAMAATASEITWLQKLLKDLYITQEKPAILYYDNQAALYISSNPVFHERTKHIEINCHYVREKMQEENLKALHVRTEHQVADILTKPLFSARIQLLSNKMGLKNIYSPS